MQKGYHRKKDRQKIPDTGQTYFLNEEIPVAVYCTDKNGLITYYNKKATDIWGRKPKLYDPSEPYFCGSLNLLYPDGSPMPLDKCPMATALIKGESYHNQQIGIEKPDGERISLLINIDPIYDPDGELTGMVNIFYDITERRAVEEERGKLAAIVESSDDAIVSKTLKGIITSWNKGAEKIFGYKEDEVIGKSIVFLIPPENREEEDYILNEIRHGRKVKSFETIRMRKDGTLLNISVTISPVKDSKGNIIGASKIARDITKQKKAQEQLLNYSDKLEQLNSYKDEFISIASHELKTPITVVKANLELLVRQINDEGQSKYLARIMRSIDKLSSQVSEMLDLSRIETGKPELTYSDFDLVDLIGQSIENLQLTHPTHQITLGKTPEEIVISADQQRIEQVLVNLITNAVKYSPNANSVLVSAASSNGEVTVSVQDHGIGIKEDQKEEIFSRFFQIERKEPTFLGLGIGLYISREIIKFHKGKIWVDSQLGKGSTFHFTIPLKPKV